MKKYLIIVDVQNDFCPGGSLAVEDGDKIIPNINKLMLSKKFNPIIATQDWHPKNHISFASRHNVTPFTEITLPDSNDSNTVWPDHCIRGTRGAAFRFSLSQDHIQIIVRKGCQLDVDSYSGFLENDKKTDTILSKLIERGNQIYVCGIATDICVVNTALDALDYGHVYVIEDACAGVTPKGTEEAIESMKKLDIHIVTTKEVIALPKITLC